MGTLRQGTGSLTGGVPFVAYPLRAEGHDASEDGLGRQTLIPVRAYGIRAANTSSNGWGIQEEASHTLDQASSHFVATSMFVRRLTPTECERLQGFPDDWTAMEEKTADSPRYRALGNAVCVNVAEWIGKRIMEVEHETRAA
jgi:DNA (cytosine-5)-methyltransferase 1